MLALWESKPEKSRSISCSKFSNNIMFGQINLVIIRLGNFSLVREPTRPFILIKFRRSHNWHQSKLPVIVNPRTRLVCLLKSPYFVCRIHVSPPITHFFRLRHPKIHTPRTSNSRVSIPCRELIRGLRPHQRIHIIYCFFPPFFVWQHCPETQQKYT